jgi:hypothetical protein
MDIKPESLQSTERELLGSSLKNDRYKNHNLKLSIFFKLKKFFWCEALNSSGLKSRLTQLMSWTRRIIQKAVCGSRYTSYGRSHRRSMDGRS